MGFSVPAVSCMLSLPSNTSLFYLKMINDVAETLISQPLFLCIIVMICVRRVRRDARQSAVLQAEWPSDVTVRYAAGWTWRPTPQSGLREGNDDEINLCPTGGQHVSAVSKLISNYPQILCVLYKGFRQELGRDAQLRETFHCNVWINGSHC